MASEENSQASAQALLNELRAKTSMEGRGLFPAEDFEQRFQEVMSSLEPSSKVLLTAASIPVRQATGNWSHAIVSVLDDQFKLALNRELIEAQKKLADSNDRLGKKMFWVAVAGLVVAVVGVVLTLVQFFKPSF